MEEERKTQIFRKESLDHLVSPEKLTDYLRVTTPGVWVVLVLVILLLAGFFAWAAIGTLETSVPAKAVVRDGTAWIAEGDADFPSIASGMTVRIGGEVFVLTAAEGKSDGFVAYASVPLENGEYDAVLILESLSPLRFLLGL